MAVDAVFTAPSGRVQVMPGFHDGRNVWKVQFNLGEAGRWSARLTIRPANPYFAKSFDFDLADADAPDFLRANRFVRGLLFEALRPAPELVSGDFASGRRPLALQGGGVTLVYFPAGGEAEVGLGGEAAWLDPRTGERRPAAGQGGRFAAPAEVDTEGHPQDFVLVAGA